jgi:predicted metalloprotease with PDZ domain
MTLRDDGGAVLVSRVRPDGPAAKAALVPDDELIAIQGRRLRRINDLSGLLRGSTPVPIVYARRGRLAETQLIPDEAVDRWRLSWDPGASRSQRDLRDQWFQIL